MASNSQTQNFYEILEVPVDAPHHEVVAAYQRAKEAYSPDSPALYTMFSKDEAAELRKLIEEAFLTLGNQKKRQEYDSVLLNRKSPQRVNLPDFAPAPESSNESAPNKTNSSSDSKKAFVRSNAESKLSHVQPTGPLPDGFAKTRISVYEIKKDLEQEIKNLVSCDGAFIRRIRLYKNINIDQLSKETRISRSYLAAIEAEDFDALPAPVFVRGFIVQLARALNFDETVAANTYIERLKKVGKV